MCRWILLLVLPALISCNAINPFAPKPKKIVLIAVDGLRIKEAQPEFAPLMVELHKKGYKVKWQNCTTDQPYNTSLSAYASVFMGIVDHDIDHNYFTGTLKYQTLFEIFPEAQLFSAWERIVSIAGNSERLHIVEHKEEGFSDQKVMEEFWAKRDKKAPLAFIHLMDTDEMAHRGQWDNYLLAAKKSAQYVNEVVKDSDDNTDFVVFSDHGRGEIVWVEHTKYLPGSNEIWTLNISRIEPVMVCGHINIFREVIRVLKL